MHDWMVIEMYIENSLNDVYQTIISFGNYIQIQYLSKQINLEVDFGSLYDAEFDNFGGHEELTIYSTENSTAIVISECNKIEMIKSTDTYMNFKIELKEGALINFVLKND